MVIARNTGFAAAFLTTLLFSSSSFLVNAQNYPSVAYPPNTWINDPERGLTFWDSESITNPILMTKTFVCGFHCRVYLQDNLCLFAIYITNEVNSVDYPSRKIVWSANRNYPVEMKAALQLSKKGDLVLRDHDGTEVWNTNTEGKFVSRLNLTEEGNLVLYGRNNEKVWQSFDHPTDTLLPGQALVSGQKLTAQLSISNSTAGNYSLALLNDRLIVFLEPDERHVYFGPFKVKTNRTEQQKIMYINGTFGPFVFPSASAFSSQFIRLDSDGHLRVYQLGESIWEEVSDLFSNNSTKRESDRPSQGHKKGLLGLTLGAILFILFIAVGIFSIRRLKNHSKEDRDEPLKNVRFERFSYEYLGAMTENFSLKLGEGGFGSVFFGSLPNSTKIAVKRLHRSGHGKKSFEAEVKTLASVHHINLVGLIGFCAEKSHWLLVYQYMQNGSLDRWIFQKNPECSLSWKSRKKIIHDVAKGLAYLHDGCNQKILHLDVKPQNILLDENFNACLADFGLSKLIDREQNQVLTTMKGTPGYMAPEWSSATITEKVDVYSFGIVVMEILCGRRNVERSQPEEEMHLLRLFTKKEKEGKLMELVDNFSEDMQSNGADVVTMMKIAAWCLQADYKRRPCMPMVLQVLEGDLNVEDNLNYDFSNPQAPKAVAVVSNKVGTTTLALPSILSGPR